MYATFKELIANQYEAAFCTVHQNIQQCPDSLWHDPVVNNPFSQSVFHGLFFADLYLGENIDAQPRQEFHKTHADIFDGYEQLEIQTVPSDTYEKTFLNEYLQHCRDKANSVVIAESIEQLQAPAGFPWLETTRAEVHVYNIRHIQHHAAQLNMKLRSDAKLDMGWVKSGWE